MSAANLNYAWSRVLIDELVRAGVKDAVICPGSRSSPLALTCADTRDLRCWSVIDERSAGFFALGLALESGRPAILVATSGTAGAHFYPAVIEAAASHVPLIVLTADRPWELQGFGAPQTIAQDALFGRFVRRFEALPLPDAADACVTHLRAVVARAAELSLRPAAGPVHLNAPFREPLAPVADGAGPVALSQRGAPRVEHPERRLSQAQVQALASDLRAHEAGVIVCGPRAPRDPFGAAVRSLGSALGWPVLAEATSGARYGDGDGVIAHYDALLQHEPFVQAHRPSLILRFGGGITSKRLQQWVDGAGAEVICVSEHGERIDPHHSATRVLECEATLLCNGLTAAVKAGGEPTSSWRTTWSDADRMVCSAYEVAFSETGRLTEPGIARQLAALWPEGGELFVSSSMPIRELDAYAPTSRGSLRVFANRGVNGIDGIVSSALGVAASSGRPTALLTGDLALLHDLGGVLTAKRHGLSLTLLVVNNDGGGIFSFLPIASTTPHFETFFGTPHGLDLSHAAHLYEAKFHRPQTPAELAAAIRESAQGGLHLIEARVVREDNPVVHRELAERARRALEGGGR